MTMSDVKKIPFSEGECRVMGRKGAQNPKKPASYIFDTPISYRENARALFFDKKPCFAVTNNDFGRLECEFYQKFLSRADASEEEKLDAFGVKWIFEPTAGGSISVCGNPRFEDVNDWKDAISMPDVENWDWAADAAAHPANSGRHGWSKRPGSRPDRASPAGQ